MNLTRDSRKERLRGQKSVRVEVKVEVRRGHTNTLSQGVERVKKKVVHSLSGSFHRLLQSSYHGGKKGQEESFDDTSYEPLLYVSSNVNNFFLLFLMICVDK